MLNILMRKCIFYVVSDNYNALYIEQILKFNDNNYNKFPLQSRPLYVDILNQRLLFPYILDSKDTYR